MTDERPLLELTDVRIAYDAIQAVRGVSFSIYPTELLALIGSNGAGKSTILRAISGLVKPQAGTMTFDGKNLIGVPAHRVVSMGIAHVPEGRQIFSSLTVRENLLLGAISRKERTDVDEDLAHIFELFPILEERYQQQGGTLSGGEQQMLAIARALMARPRLLLLDEPSLGLAPLMVRRIFEVVQRLKDDGVTILLVEQNARQALAIADRACVFETGVITLEGTAAELASNSEVERAYLGTSQWNT
jgi:branched-chain amino acid transport system ATP-binding protein